MRKGDRIQAVRQSVSRQRVLDNLDPVAREWLEFREANGLEGVARFEQDIQGVEAKSGEAIVRSVVGHMVQFNFVDDGSFGTMYVH